MLSTADEIVNFFAAVLVFYRIFWFPLKTPKLHHIQNSNPLGQVHEVMTVILV